MKLTNEEKAKVLSMYTDCQTKGGDIIQYCGNTPDFKNPVVYYPKEATMLWCEWHQIVARTIPLAKISCEDAIEVAKIACGTQYIDIEDVMFCNQPTVKEHHTIYQIKFKAFEVIKHIDDKPKEFMIYVNSWGTINMYVDGHLSNNRYDCFIWQYLISKGYAVPIYFSPNHEANGKDAIQLGIAIDKTIQ